MNLPAWRFASTIFCVMGLAALAGPADARENQALLVTNSDYHTLEPLPVTERDGQALEALLKATDGFEHDLVKRHPNLESGEFWDHWQIFLSGLSSSGVAVFYFSGHGVELDNDSYLLPVDLPENAPDARILQDGISLNRLFSEFRKRQLKLAEEYRATIHGVFIIDACRTGVPNRKGKGKKNFADKSATVPIAPPPGMFVMYAASAGQVAHTKLGENDAEMMSVYTRKLLPLLRKPISLQTAARKVRWQVYSEVAGVRPHKSPQKPTYFDDLINEIDIGGVPRQFDGANPVEENLSGGSIKVRREGGSLVWECEFCPELVVLPKGGVQIGSQRNEPGRDRFEDAENSDSEEARLTVHIAQPFAIGTTEVTRAQYWSYLTKNGTSECPPGHSACDTRFGDKPVSGVSWHDARGYVDWLNKKLKLGGNTNQGRYRLPREVEWEYAARGGSLKPFVFGDEREKLCSYGNGADISLKSVRWVNTTCSDSKARDVAQVASYKPNAFGLYDVHGNLWEWVADCWTDRHETIKADGRMSGTLEDKKCRRVARGGSWRSAPEALRLAKRTAFSSDHTRPTLGFRVMRELTEAELLDGSE